MASLHRRGLGNRGQRQRRVPARHGHPRPDRRHRAAGSRDGHRALPVPWPAGRRPYRHPDHQGGKALRHRDRDDVRGYPPAAGRARNARRSVASRRTRAHRGRAPRTAFTRALRPRAAGRYLPAPVHGPGRSAPASRRRRLRHRAPVRAAADARLVPAPGCRACRHPRPVVRGRRIPAHRLQRPAADRMDADGRAHGPYPGQAGTWLAPLPLCDPVRLRRFPRRGRRGVGQRRAPGGSVAPTRPRPRGPEARPGSDDRGPGRVCLPVSSSCWRTCRARRSPPSGRGSRRACWPR